MPEIPRVLVTQWVHREVLDALEGACEVVANPAREPWPRERLLELAAEADAMIAFMPDHVDDAFLSRCPRLRIIAGALKGTDNFDVGACSRRGVWLTRVPDLLTAPTADLAIGLLIALTRNLLAGDDLVRSGRFAGWRPVLYGQGLAGATLGIIGFGAVGEAVAGRAAAFGMRVIYADCAAKPTPHARVALEELLAASDFVMPLVHLTPETYHLIGHEALARMKRGACLVNVGRGSIVDELAVAAALAHGRLGGYAADVFEMEDWAINARLRAIPRELLADRQRTFFTPHLGSAVDEVRREIALEAARSVLEALQGRVPRNALNDPRETRRFAFALQP